VVSRHGDGILSGPIDGDWRAKAVYPDVEARAGMTVVHRGSGTRGTVVRLDREWIVLRTVTGERLFRLTPGGFEVDRKAVTLVRPARTAPAKPAVTASGSVNVTTGPAKVAAASRIWVEGVHDAELVEKVWGNDLRQCAIVVERLDGIDDLAREVASFRPGPTRRLGVLVDHLVAGSKEARIAAAVQSPHVLVTGTPYVDIWQAIRPKVLGIDAWPVVPRGRPWKEGICEAFGVAEPGVLWRKLLASVTTYADLEPALVGAVEQLIDFVTAEP
jgi:hypothetical protein